MYRSHYHALVESHLLRLRGARPNYSPATSPSGAPAPYTNARAISTRLTASPSPHWHRQSRIFIVPEHGIAPPMAPRIYRYLYPRYSDLLVRPFRHLLYCGQYFCTYLHVNTSISSFPGEIAARGSEKMKTNLNCAITLLDFPGILFRKLMSI